MSSKDHQIFDLKAGYKLKHGGTIAKIVRVKGSHQAQQAADFVAHLQDLKSSKSALETIQAVNEKLEGDILKNTVASLWQTAVANFIKCFRPGTSRGQVSRHTLNEGKIFKGGLGSDREKFDFFLNLRNKHLEHDANVFTQSILGLALNHEGRQPKAFGVVALYGKHPTLTEETYSQLFGLISKAIDWCEKAWDDVQPNLLKELEKQPYEALNALEEVEYPDISLADVAKLKTE